MTSKPVEAPKSNEGMEGMVAGDSAISTVGLGLGLNYRGYNIGDLAKHCVFEEIIHLLLFGTLPTQQQLSDLQTRISKLRKIPPILAKILETLPKESNCMDVMRTISSIMGILEPESENNDHINIALRLMAVFGPALNYWYHFTQSGKRIKTELLPSDSIALNFLKLYHQRDDIDPLIVKTFDVSLILYAEHDFNASTFAARVTVSTRSDFYSGITSAIGTLRGPLHGGANEAAMKMLEGLKSVEESNAFLEGKWKAKDLIMGFGHRIYKKDDPRSNIIKEYSVALSKTANGRPKIVEISQNIEAKMIKEKQKWPNLDFYSASAYNQCGIHTYYYIHSVTSLRLSSSFPGPPAGQHTSSSKGSPRRSSDPSPITLDQDPLPSPP
jgi:2-methylcitrate synthase